MLRYLTTRLLQSIAVLYVITTVVFLMMYAVPGGPFSDNRNVSEAVLNQLKTQYGLNDPIAVQYKNYLWNNTPKKLDLVALSKFNLEEAFGVDLGYSFRYEGRKVNDLIKSSFPISLELGFYSLLFATTIGIATGTIAALNHNTIWDYLPMGLMTLGICIPAFVIGPILILTFGFWVPESLRLPVLFWESSSIENWQTDYRFKILPTATLGFYYAAGISRLTRSSMLETLKQEFITTAKAKGLGEFTILTKHALRAAITPVISYLGPVAAHLVTGSFIVEYIFMIPGMGRHLVNAALNRDYTLIMGTVLLYACILIIFNFLVDFLVASLNPKTKLTEA